MKSYLNLMKFRFFYLVTIVVSVTGCVSVKKYNELGRRMNFSEEQRKKCGAELQNAQAGLDTVSRSRDELRQTLSKSTTMLAETRKQQQALMETYRNLENNVISENERARRENKKFQSEIAAKDSLIHKLTLEVVKLKTELQTRQERQQSRIDTLYQTVSRSLYNFEGSELKIIRYPDKVVVAFAENLLFKSEKYETDDNGRIVLQILARTLMPQKEIKMQVVSCIDKAPLIREQVCLEDYWDLAVLRSASVARFFSTAEFSLSPVAAVAQLNTGNSKPEIPFRGYWLEVVMFY